MSERTRRRAVAAIRGDRSRGASELARQALEELAAFARAYDGDSAQGLVDNAEDLARALAGARPGMPSIASLVGRWRDAVQDARRMSLGAARKQLASCALKLQNASREAVAQIARQAEATLAERATVMTISRSSTVVETLLLLGRDRVQVIACESRPGMEGHALVEEINGAGIDSQLITEAQIGHFVADANLVMVGADAVLVDGTVVNKAGTYLLALAAREADVPFWVCCESFKRSALGPDEFPLEEMEAAALAAPRLEHCRIRNVAFDLTPAHFVTRWIDERGSTLGRPGPAEDAKEG